MTVTIAFDSQAITYFLRANSGLEFPPPEGALTDLDNQHIATIRLAFAYHVYVAPVSRAECLAISDEARREEHERFLCSFFHEIQRGDIDPIQIETDVARFKTHHHGGADCRMVAEAIAARMNVLVTNDRRLRAHLSQHAGALRLLSPVEAWTAYKREAVRVPATGHPLADARWWRW
jgi:hypothetical protein